MATDPMTDALQAIRDYVVDGEPVKPGPWQDLEPQSHEWTPHNHAQGRSANHDLLWAACLFLLEKPIAEHYLLDRCLYELDAAFGSTEAFSPSYWALHRCLWTVVVRYADGELKDLAAQWLDYDLLISAMNSRLKNPAGHIETWTPGQRADVGARRVEGDQLALALGRPVRDLEYGDWWGLVWEIYDEVSSPLHRFDRGWVGSLLIDKTNHVPEWIDQIRTLSPYTWRSYGPDSWACWTERGTHGQDPPLLGVAVEEGEVETLHPVPDGDPPEGGWSGQTSFTGSWKNEIGAWWNRYGKFYQGDSIFLPEGDYREIRFGGRKPAQPSPPDEPDHTEHAARHADALAGVLRGERPDDRYTAQDHLDAIRWHLERR